MVGEQTSFPTEREEEESIKGKFSKEVSPSRGNIKKFLLFFRLGSKNYTFSHAFLLCVVFILFSVVHVNAEDRVPMLISIPKSGSNLLLKLTKMLYPDKEIVNSIKFNMEEFPGTDPWRSLNENALLEAKQTGCPLLGIHLNYWLEENRTLMEKYHVQGVFIFRDFRDQIVSNAFWLKKKVVELANVPLEDLITYLIVDRGCIKITGLNIDLEKPTKVKTCYDYLQTFLPWIDYPNVYTVRFEDLIGPKGGGSKEKQLIAIMSIAKHFGVPLDQEEADDIAEKLFGGTYTFRKGLIGDWKNYFTEEHKALFKEYAGELLIEYGYEEDLDW